MTQDSNSNKPAENTDLFAAVGADSSVPEQSSKRPVKLKIMKREYTVACSEDEKEQLIKAADYLDAQMQKVAKGGQVLGADRYAVLAGLNISNELLQLRKLVDDEAQLKKRLNKLCDQVELAIGSAQQVGI